MDPKYVLLVIHAVQGLDFKVNFDSFDMVLKDNKHSQQSINLRALADSSNENQPTTNKSKKKKESRPDCMYLYPEKKQVDIILSNMMNELTQVFVGANNWLTEKVSRRVASTNLTTIRRKMDRRFKIAHRKQKLFFENIYFNMTNDYNKVYQLIKKKQLRGGGADGQGGDPCRYQRALKALWDAVLRRAERTLRRAVQRCVREYVRDQRLRAGSRLAAKLNNYLLREIERIKTDQLKLLCDKLQICYDEILKQFRWKTNIGNDDFNNSVSRQRNKRSTKKKHIKPATED